DPHHASRSRHPTPADPRLPVRLPPAPDRRRPTPPGDRPRPGRGAPGGLRGAAVPLRPLDARHRRQSSRQPRRGGPRGANRLHPRPPERRPGRAGRSDPGPGRDPPARGRGVPRLRLCRHSRRRAGPGSGGRGGAHRLPVRRPDRVRRGDPGRSRNSQRLHRGLHGRPRVVRAGRREDPGAAGTGMTIDPAILETLATGAAVSAVNFALVAGLAAVGGTLTERAGVLNLTHEGVLLLGGASAAVVAFDTGSVWLGAAAGTVAGLLLGVIKATWSVLVRTEQVVNGILLVPV